MPGRPARHALNTDCSFANQLTTVEVTMTQLSATGRCADPSVPMTAEDRAAFERDGHLIIRDALCPDEVAAARDAVGRVYAAMAKAHPADPPGRAGFRFLGSPPHPATRDAPHEIPDGTLGHAFVLGACHPRWRTPADVRIH